MTYIKDNIDKLCEKLAIEREVFENILKNKDGYVLKGRIPKSRGGFRVIYHIVNEPYGNLLKNLSRIINGAVPFPDCAHGFLPGKSIITNASQHLGKQTVINADIKSFFQSITKVSVRSVFKKIGFDDEQSEVLAAITTLNGVLATGFATSPIVSNVVCLGLDEDFSSLAQRHRATYTRYGDDISISGNDDMPSKSEIEGVFQKHGFKMNQEKYRVQKKGGSQYVTGLTVCDPQRPHLSKRLKRRLRLETYYNNKYGMDHLLYHLKYRLKHHVALPHIFNLARSRETALGWTYFAASIDPKFAAWLGRMWSTEDHELLSYHDRYNT
jgi:retron-type reverse transcriptase